MASSTSRVNGVMMPKKRRSKEEFEAFLKVLFDNDSLQVKYQHPDAWRLYNLKKRIMLVNFEQSTIKGKKGSCRGYRHCMVSQL
jgi:hypothetical protein